MKVMKRISAALLAVLFGGMVAMASDLRELARPVSAQDEEYLRSGFFSDSAPSAQVLDTTLPQITILNETSVYVESIKVVGISNTRWRLSIENVKTSASNRVDSVVNLVTPLEIWDTMQGQFTLSAGIGVYCSNFNDTLGYTLEYVPMRPEFFDAIVVKAYRPPSPETATLRGFSYKIRRLRP